MKRKLSIVLLICLYTSIIAYIFDNIGTQTLVKNGGTYQFARKTPDGFKCLITYVDKESKETPKTTLLVAFEDKASSSCPDPSQSKKIETTKIEALKIVEKRLNDPNFILDKAVILGQN